MARQSRYLQTGAGADQLVPRLVKVGVELDGPLVLLHRPAKQVARAALEQVAVVLEGLRVGPVASSSLVQRQRFEINRLVPGRLVSLQQPLLVDSCAHKPTLT